MELSIEEVTQPLWLGLRGYGLGVRDLGLKPGLRQLWLGLGLGLGLWFGLGLGLGLRIWVRVMVRVKDTS